MNKMMEYLLGGIIFIILGLVDLAFLANWNFQKFDGILGIIMIIAGIVFMIIGFTKKEA